MFLIYNQNQMNLGIPNIGKTTLRYPNTTPSTDSLVELVDTVIVAYLEENPNIVLTAGLLPHKILADLLIPRVNTMVGLGDIFVLSNTLLTKIKNGQTIKQTPSQPIGGSTQEDGEDTYNGPF